MKVFLPASIATLLVLTACQQVAQAPVEPVAMALTASPVPGVLEDGEICDAGDENFVRRIVPLLLGRRPASVREVALLLSVIEQGGRETLVRALMRTEAFALRWREQIKDLLHVNRVGERTNDCGSQEGYLWKYTGDLAAFVRDHAPDRSDQYSGEWNLTDLIASSIYLDDLSPIYRAQFFAQLGSKIINLDNPDANTTWRAVYGDIFERTYLNRRMGCLGCHNSEYSVTGSEDPALDRTWEVPGLFEKALYGDSTGRPVKDLAAFFRIEGVLSMLFVPEGVSPTNFWTYGVGHKPWGITSGCGEFILPDDIEPDPEEWTAYLGKEFNDRPSIWDLEKMLHSGFDKLRSGGLKLAEDATVDPEEAFAYLTCQTLAEKVWIELTGRRLTAPHFFPRNRYQRDLLMHLTSTFIENGFSLKELILKATLHPYFNPGHPSQCDVDKTYFMAPIYNPWSVNHDVEALRGNSVGDIVERLPPRVLINAATTAMEWTSISDPNVEVTTEDVILEPITAFQIDIGVFLLDGETGFRGHNVLESLSWEMAMGACRDPYPDDPNETKSDWMNRLLAAASPSNTLEDAIATLKDRLMNIPRIKTKEERVLMEALTGVALDTQLKHVLDVDGVLRRVCAAFLASPEFTLAGAPVSNEAGREPPITVPGNTQFEICNQIRVQFFEPGKADCDAAGNLSLQAN